MEWDVAAQRLASLLAEDYDAGQPNIIFTGQVHGDRVVPVRASLDQPFRRIDACDGLVTADPGVFLVIRTADCVPIVLVDRESMVCGACHAGWRGTRANIVSKTVTEMVVLGARPATMSAWIGPCIAGDSYQVSADLAEDFRREFGALGHFSEGRMLDLVRLNRLLLQESGVPSSAISDTGLCTYKDEHLFHSHRRQSTVRGHQFTLCGWRKG